MSHRISRRDLFETIWAAPMRDAAEQFNISDVGLRKVCKKAKLPIPPQGYWARKPERRVGVKPKLPSRDLGMPDIIEISAASGWGVEDRNALLTLDLPAPPEFEATISDVFLDVRKMVPKVKVRRDFDRCHPFINKLLRDDEVRRQKQLTERFPSFWNDPIFDSPFERRRLAIIDAIFSTCSKLDMKPSLHGKEACDLSILVGNQNVSFYLDDPKSINPHDRYRQTSKKDRPASDKMELRIASWRDYDEIKQVWSDATGDKIEKHLTEIVINIIVCGEASYRAQLIRSHEWMVERKAELIEEERLRIEAEAEEIERQKVRAQRGRVRRLLQEAKNLRRAIDIREYVALARSHNSEISAPWPREQFNTWAIWALCQADSIDPIKSGEFLKKLD